MTPIPDGAQANESQKPDNVRLSGTQSPVDRRKAPRTTADIARKYARTQRLSEGQIGAEVAKPTPGTRTADLASQVHDHLRERSLVHCDRFLTHAALRWLQSTCRSDDSARVYLRTFIRWLIWYGQASCCLSAQCGMLEVDVVNHLRFLEEEAGLSVRSVVHARQVLASWFHFLHDLHLLDRMPIGREAKKSWRIRQERIQRGDGTRQALTLAEARILGHWALRVAQPVQGFAVLLQVVAGLRSFEVASCARRHLTISDDIQRLVVVGKGQKQRIVTLEPIVVQAWQRYSAQARLRGDRGSLIGHGRRRYDRDTIQRWAKEALRIAGRPDLSSHDLRRTACTLLMDRGATLEQARTLLGHSSSVMTEKCYVARQQPLSVTTGIHVEESP